MTALIVHSADPLNAETPLARLRERFITGQGDFYVRSHGSIPATGGAQHRLSVQGRVARPLELSTAELRSRFPQRRVTAAMQCAGNRRADLQAVSPVSGDPWAPGAIGNAEWTGVALADVLRAAEVEVGAGEELHVGFGALDSVTENGRTFRYGVSIPLAKALSSEVLLAWAMNGSPLTPQHGFPLRAVVPGYAGVRSAKWLGSIEIRDAPSECPIQADDYKLHPAAETDADPSHALTIPALTINDMPLNSAICEPAPHASLPPGPTRLRGYAISTTLPLSRVEISADAGRSWIQAALEQARSPWSWSFWEAIIPLGKGRHDLVVRAWDGAGQTQPASPDEVWNHRGYLCNAWHRVSVTVA